MIVAGTEPLPAGRGGPGPLEGAVPGPWEAQEDTWNESLFSSAEPQGKP